MALAVRPRRSALYVPGSNARALDKARTLPADVLLLDLEDAVAPDAKEAARENVLAVLRAREGFGFRELVVRVNGLDTAWGWADLAALARAGADAILLPKVESADGVRRARTVLGEAGAPAELPIWCMMETPRGILRALEIAEAPAVACLVMGTSDLTKDLHALHTGERLPMLVALGTCLLAARAAGIAILDGVHLDLSDTAGFAAACRQGRELGFDGKTLIHPSQIGPANAAFGPDAAAVEQARRIVAAYEEARARGAGVAVLDGRLIEALHVREAERVLALAAAIAERGG
ncbi:MAG: CoA ester lyase [Geminicoccaceae bacterium]|nr:MAG: CoA ester lyase [Geminicoccaceae bacterium]